MSWNRSSLPPVALVSLEITASMAEFNNPLGIIIGFAQDLFSEHPGGPIFTICLPCNKNNRQMGLSPAATSRMRGYADRSPVTFKNSQQ